MLSIKKDFHWTCTAIDHPLYAFKFKHRKTISGVPYIVVDILINVEKKQASINLYFEEEKGKYECPSLEEFYEFTKQLIESVL